MISWENSQKRDIALHMVKENASFGTGLHLGYCFDVKKDYYLYKLKHCIICFCGAFVKEVWWMIVHAKDLALIICILGLKLVFEVRKNRVSGDLLAVCFAGMQHYVFSKICNEGGGF